MGTARVWYSIIVGVAILSVGEPAEAQSRAQSSTYPGAWVYRVDHGDWRHERHIDKLTDELLTEASSTGDRQALVVNCTRVGTPVVLMSSLDAFIAAKIDTVVVNLRFDQRPPQPSETWIAIAPHWPIAMGYMVIVPEDRRRWLIQQLKTHKELVVRVALRSGRQSTDSSYALDGAAAALARLPCSP